MASYVSQYRGIGQMQPSGYTELLASGGQSIADGISKFGDSVGDAIKRYQEQKQKSASLDGIIEARASNKISKFQGQIPPDADMSKYLAPESPEMQKLWSKFSSGKASYDDKLRLAGYESAMSDLEDRARKREVEALQLEAFKNEVLTKQAMSDSLLAGQSLPDVTGSETVTDTIMSDKMPTYLGDYMNAVESGTATPDQRAEVARYFEISGEPQVGPASSIGDMSKPQNESAVPPEGVRIMAETLGNYSNMPISEGVRATRERLAANIEALKNSPTYASGNRVPIDRNTYIGGMGYGGNVNQKISWTNRYGSGSRSPNVGEVNERLRRTAAADKMEAEKAAKIEAAQRRLSEFNSMTGFQPQPQPSASAAPAAAPSVSFSERADAPNMTQTVERTVETSRPASPEERFAKSLKTFAASGALINPDVLKQLKDSFGIADMRVVKGDGYDVVMVNGEAKHIDASGGKRLTPTEVAALEARSIYPENGGGFVGVAPTADEAKKFREMVASDEDTARGIDALLEIAKRGGKLNPNDRADASVISTILKARNRLNIVGPGAVSEADWILLDSAFQNPTEIVTLKEMNVQKLKQTRSQLRSMLESTAKSLGLRPVDGLGKGTVVGGKNVLTFNSNGTLVE